MDPNLPKPTTQGSNSSAAADTSQDSASQTPPNQPNQVSPISTREGGKEKEPIVASVDMEAVGSPEEAVTAEVREMGIEVHPENIDLSLDVKKLGVAPSGPSQPIVHQGASTAAVSLPISDDQVVAGLHANLASSLRWLAEWCMRELKRAHVALRVVHGKVFRVRVVDESAKKKQQTS